MFSPLATTPTSKIYYVFTQGSTTTFNDTKYQYYDYSKITDVAIMNNNAPPTLKFMNYMHDRNVRVSITLGDHDFDKAKFILPKYRYEKIKELMDFCIKYDIDGINLDLEKPFYSHTLHQGYVDFIHELKISFKTYKQNSMIVVCAPYGPYQIFCLNGRCLPWDQIAEAADYLYIMSYDAQTSLFRPQAIDPIKNVERGWNLFLNNLKIPPTKLIQSVPWYSAVYLCHSQPKIPDGDCRVNILDGMQWQYTDWIFEKYIKLGQSQGFEIIYNSNYDAYRITFQEDDPTSLNFEKYYLIYFSDLSTLQNRFDRLALSTNAGGLSSWWAKALNYVDVEYKNRTENLWNQMHKNLERLEDKFGEN